MFAFLKAGEVYKDATALKKLTDLVVEKYASLPRRELNEALRRDFDCLNFVFDELKEFRFVFATAEIENPPYNLCVIGNEKYQGFMLSASAASGWYCFAADRMDHKATVGSKKLAKIMHRKFGVVDISNAIWK